MRRSKPPSFGGDRGCLLLPAVWLLFSSTLISFCHGHGASSSPNLLSTIQFQGLRREVLEGAENGTLILAAERTHRKDPLNHFKYYSGGWNVTDPHYIASVAFSAVPFIVIAIAWFVLLGLFLFCTCICCCCVCCGCGCRSCGYSRVCHILSLIILILFTVAAIIGCAMLYTGQGEFYSSVEDTFTYLVRQGTNVLSNLTGLWSKIQSAKDIQLDGHYLFPSEFRENIVHFNQMIYSSNITFPDRVSNQTIHLLTQTLNPVRLFLNVIAGVMLGIAFLGFVFSLFGLRVLVYLLVVLGWILVTATLLLSSVFLVFHNIVADTCMAMDQWAQNPTAESALSQLLPCMDRQTVDETLNITRRVTFTTVEMVNTYIANVSNDPPQPAEPFPLYHNQLGPLVPLLCNPLDEGMNPRPCSSGEVALANASQEYKSYVCQVNPSGICITQGRLTPTSYDQVVGAANVGYTLDHYGPFLASLVDCTFVRDTFRDIGNNHCPRLSQFSQWIYAGLAMVSGAVMFSLFLWLLYVRQRRHRVYTRKSMVEMTRL